MTRTSSSLFKWNICPDDYGYGNDIFGGDDEENSYDEDKEVEDCETVPNAVTNRLHCIPAVQKHQRYPTETWPIVIQDQGLQGLSKTF